MDKQIKIRFRHGLGDCAYAVHQLQLYRSRGYQITVDCDPEKAVLFEPFGIQVRHCARFPAVSWEHAPEAPLSSAPFWSRNKAFHNVGRRPLPPILGSKEELFQEFASVRLDVSKFLKQGHAAAFKSVETYLHPLPRPVVLLHTKGNSFQETKSVPDSECLSLYRALIDELGGTVILLDWDNRVPRASSYRLRHLTADWKWLELPELLAALCSADLVVGIDSGPLHLCRFTDVPAIGLWLHNCHHPATYSLPRSKQVNLVFQGCGSDCNRFTRIPFNILECPSDGFDPSWTAAVARRMLSSPQYVDSAERGNAGDVQLQHFVHDRTRGDIAPGARVFNDRNVGFDLLLKHLKKCADPCIVETGCIRAEEDFTGAGFSTYLFGASLHRLGRGHLDSIDTNPDNVAFAKRWTRIFAPRVHVHRGDSVDYLGGRRKLIDLLYLDSLDLQYDHAANQGRSEIRAAEHVLAPGAIVCWDDTYWAEGSWHGKGGLGVPYLLEKGWTVLHSGYQTILTSPHQTLRVRS